MSEYNPYSLKGKAILVTGASSGIGRATAIECSKMGAKVIITGRNQERLNETFKELKNEGHLQVIAELSNKEELEHLVDFIPEIDGFVNNAGITKLLTTPFINKKDISEILEINTIVPILLTQKLLKRKKIRKNASIVFTSSIAGNYYTSPGRGMYATSKSAITAFMKNAALELAPKGIRCNSVAPGMILTNIMGHNLEIDEQSIRDMQTYPLKRYGRPEEVAYAIIYLLSNAAAWVTGTSLIIDGGKTLQ
jgi:NAD(P)-dependent dehydrogenase (short-subunit alcohol dehydrogenase family)